MITSQFSRALLPSLLLVGIHAVPNMMKVKSCNGNGRKCSMDVSGFSLNRPVDEVSQIDLGPGRSYACKSKGAPKGRGATFHAECTGASDSSGGGEGKGKGKGKGGGGGSVGGAMNAINCGKNSRGEDLLCASVSVGNEVCRIGPDATGLDSVVDCTPADEFPPEDDPMMVDPMEEVQVSPDGSMRERFRELVVAPVDEKKGQSASGLRGRRGLQSSSTLDIMVVWTKNAECARSGLAHGCTLTDQTETNIRGTIDLAVAETNTAYDNSGVLAQLRLVHAYREDTYTETSGASAALNAITSKTDGVMDDVHDKRTSFGADLVALIIDGACGVAWLGPSYSNMFSVTAWNCATGYYTFGHEIGHNMGCNHDKGTKGQCGTSGYNYGYRDPSSRFRSILAYNCGGNRCGDETSTSSCTRVQYFSNPYHQFNGETIGNSTVDNARRINEVRATIAAYEATIPTCNQDSDCNDNDPCTTNKCDTICVYDPIDCDDGDACTEDTCSAGTCVHSDISASCDDDNSCTTDTCDVITGCSNTPDASLSCDDGNACTNDSCDVFGECKSTPIMGCCGNGICEAGEDCPVDCFTGPFTLPGPQCTSCYIQDGHMFDVVAKDKDVSVTSLKIRYYAGTTCEVWTRAGTHDDFKNSPSGWTKVATHTVVASAWATVEIPESSFTQSVLIPAGERQAFYVTMETGGNLLYQAGAALLTAVNVEDDNLIMYEGPAKVFSFGGQTGPRRFNGHIVYTTGGGTPTTLAPTPPPTRPTTSSPTDAPTNNPTPSPTAAPTGAPTNKPTPSPTGEPQPSAAPTSAPTNQPTASPTDAPTNDPTPSPTASPTGAPTNDPTASPTSAPTNSPTPNPTASPTNDPTKDPTASPTNAPTNEPTSAPTLSLAPTPFQPETVVMVKDTNSASIIRSAYFEVQAGEVWSQITDLKIISYGARAMEVYYKLGDAAPYEATPCAWKKVAETDDSYNPGNWKRVWPDWVNGFEPVVLPANQKVSFYVALTGSSNGILGEYNSNENRYSGPHQSTAITSAVGAISMSRGRKGYSNQRFNPYPTNYKGYGMYGGLKFETLPPGSTNAPTMAPTAPWAPRSIESPISGSATDAVNGLQFKVENIGSKDVIVTRFKFLLDQPGMHHVEVWYRDGTYKGSSSSACDNWNNWCNEWSRVAFGDVDSPGPTAFSETPPLVAIAKAGAITSFAIVSAEANLLTMTATAGIVDDGVLKISLASPIEDYYAGNVQTVHALSPTEVKFEGGIVYDVAQSECAVLSTSPWVVLDPLAADQDMAGQEGEEVVENVIEDGVVGEEIVQ